MTRDASSLFCDHLWTRCTPNISPKAPLNTAYKSLTQSIDRTMERLASTTGPTYTCLYKPSTDIMPHKLGTKQEEIKAAIRDLDLAQGRLSQSLGGGARLLVSTNQGFPYIPPAVLGQLNATC